MRYYAKLVLNRRRSRNKNDELVFKKHFEHPLIDEKMVLEVFGGKILNWSQDEGISLLIMNESKFHTQMLVQFMQSHGVQIYPGSGKSLEIERKMVIRLEAMTAFLRRRNLRKLTKKLKQTLCGEKKSKAKTNLANATY